MSRVFCATLLLLSAAAQAETFHFVAIGDTAYNPSRDYPVYAPELRAVRIDVDTDTPWVFSFSPLYLE